MLFHPAYTIVNAGVCGRISDTALAGFGLGSLTLGIMLISIGICFSQAVMTFVSQAHGAKDRRMCRVYLYRQYYLNTPFFIFACVPLVFIRTIYGWIGQDAKVADLAA